MDELLIPFVPYPVNPDTGLPVETKLKPLDNKSDLKFNASSPCVITGIPAPTLAVTIHPRTGAILPLSGTFNDPITRLPVAIEVHRHPYKPPVVAEHF